MLDRQRALNALTWEMVSALSAQLAAWREDPAVGRGPGQGGARPRVLRRRRHPRRHRPGAPAKGSPRPRAFFRDEYRLNWRIHTFPKPYIALLDGITMGGGVGISVHGGYRVVTENTLFAMPETGIGFFPDVGATWFLPRCPGEVGMYLGLTGARLDAADCLDAGIGTHAVPAADLERLEDGSSERLGAADPPAASIADPGEFRPSRGRRACRAAARHRPHASAARDLQTIFGRLCAPSDAASAPSSWRELGREVAAGARS